MIELVAEGVIENTRNKKYIIDTASELSQLEAGFGNEAYCIADKTTYICDGTGSYVEKGDEGGGSSISTEPLSVTTNGTYRAPSGTAYSPVTVNVTPTLGTKNITENGTYVATSDNEDGYSSVTVNVTAVSKLPAVVDKSISTITAGDLEGSTKVGVNAFYYCTSLESVEVPSGVGEIDINAFYGCTALNNVDLHSGLTKINNYAFGCDAPGTASVLESIFIPSTVTTIGSCAFQYRLSLKEANLPSGLQSLGTSAFQYTGITSIEFPTAIISVPSSICSNCPSLSSVSFHSNITSIGSSAFLSNTSLTSIDIPASVTQIYTQAFKSASNLASVTVRATTPPKLQNISAFQGCAENLKIYVPAASVDTYKAASNWSNYADVIKAIPS